MVVGARERHEQQQRIHPRVIPPRGKLADRVRGAVDPQIVAIDDEHRRIAQQVARMHRSEEHTSELQSLMRISYAVFCLKKKKNINTIAKIKQHLQYKPHNKK